MSVAERPQHMVALEWANTVRLGRARVRNRVAAGEATVADAFEHWACQTAAVCDVLMYQRRWGRKRARRLLVNVGVPENKYVGTLTERQRHAILARVAGRRDS